MYLWIKQRRILQALRTSLRENVLQKKSLNQQQNNDVFACIILCIFIWTGIDCFGSLSIWRLFHIIFAFAVSSAFVQSLEYMQFETGRLRWAMLVVKTSTRLGMVLTMIHTLKWYFRYEFSIVSLEVQNVGLCQQSSSYETSWDPKHSIHRYTGVWHSMCKCWLIVRWIRRWLW